MASNTARLARPRSTKRFLEIQFHTVPGGVTEEQLNLTALRHRVGLVGNLALRQPVLECLAVAAFEGRMVEGVR